MFIVHKLWLEEAGAINYTRMIMSRSQQLKSREKIDASQGTGSARRGREKLKKVIK